MLPLRLPLYDDRDINGPLRTSQPLFGHSLTTIHGSSDALIFGGAREGGSGQNLLYLLRTGADIRKDLQMSSISPSGQRPPARLYHAAAFDSERRRLVIFGGLVEEGKPIREALNDTWFLYDVAGRYQWSSGPPFSRPLYGSTMVYSEDHQTPIFFGGQSQDQDPSNGVFALICVPPTATPTATATRTATPTRTPTRTPTATLPPSATPTDTPSPTVTNTVTLTATPQATETPTPHWSAYLPYLHLPYVSKVVCAAREMEPNDTLDAALQAPNRLLPLLWTCGWLRHVSADDKDNYLFQVDQPTDAYVYVCLLYTSYALGCDDTARDHLCRNSQWCVQEVRYGMVI